jgi:hypothetical protein
VLYHTLLLLSLCLLWPLPAQAASCFPQATLPPLVAQGQRLALPSHGHTTPLFIALGFEPTQQANLEATLAAVQALATGKGSPLKLAEIAVVDQQHQPYAKQIEPFMQKAVQDKRWLPVVYPYYANKASLRQTLGLGAKANTTYVLCDSKGQRLWQANTARLSPQQLEALKQAW